MSCLSDSTQRRENAKLEAKSSKQGDGSKGGTDRTRYTGTTLLRALVRACRGKLLRMGLLLVVDSAVHIFQVRVDKMSLSRVIFEL